MDGTTVSVRELTGNEGTAFVFWSNQCPWTDRYEDRLQSLVQDYQSSGIQFVLVNANEIADSSQDALEAIQTRAERRGYETPYVRDSKARLAQNLGASRTPHVFVFDGGGTLLYKGAIDDSPSGSQVEHPYLRDALEALIRNDTPAVQETEPFGCTLKYP